MLSAWQMQELERRVKAVICPVCTERRPDGSCELTDRECPVMVHLPRLVEITASVHSDSMDAYAEKVRAEVCTVCRSALFSGAVCESRQEGRCALDAYLLPIIQVIDDCLTRWTPPRSPATSRKPEHPA